MIFDSLAHSLLQVRQNGRCTHVPKFFFDSAESLIAASETHWVQIIITGKGPLVRWAISGEWQIAHLRLNAGVRIGDAASLIARGDSGGVLLEETRFPFRVLYDAPGTDPVVLLDPSVTFSATERRLLQRWIALLPVHVDHGYLQVLADPTSDKRRFELYNDRGMKVRESKLDVAMGILDADTRTRTILALRDAGWPELVTYRWRWRAPTP